MFAALALLVVWLVLAAQFGSLLMIWVGVFACVVWVVCLAGFIVNGPNQARVVQLFGKYVGTLRDVGFFYGNPFYWRTRVSLRVRTFETGMTKTEETKDAAGRVVVAGSTHREPIKVNDKDGTPIEISAVVGVKVVKPAEAVFQVDDYEQFVQLQADAALRNLASRYSYDGDIRSIPAEVLGANPNATASDSHSLRGHIEE